LRKSQCSDWRRSAAPRYIEVQIVVLGFARRADENVGFRNGSILASCAKDLVAPPIGNAVARLTDVSLRKTSKTAERDKKALSSTRKDDIAC
jgi:hypothetical protein